MKEKNVLPIVGMTDYGFLASIIEIGGKPYLCSPNISLEKMVPENTLYFCMQNQQLSPIEILGMLMWVLEHAVVGGYETNADDTINFLKTNGITMRQGEIKLTFDIRRTEQNGYIMTSHDDRDLVISHYDSLDDMARAFYNMLIQMSQVFNVCFDVILLFRGKEADEFASLINDYHKPLYFNLATLND